jgi:SAM-dependent methyltransferase
MPHRVRRVSALEGYELWARGYDAAPNPVVAIDGRHSVRLLAPSRGETILDAGCGTGRNLGPIIGAGASAVGIDFSPGMLGVAHQRYGAVPMVAADLQRPLPFRDATFDAVLCALVGEHLEALSSTLTELRRVTKTPGRLVFSVYHPEMAAAGIEANFELEGTEYRLGAIRYAVDDYLELVAEAGFRRIEPTEFRGDESLARSVPSAARFLGKPMLLVIRAAA